MDGLLSYLDKDKQWQQRRYVLDSTQLTRYPEEAAAHRNSISSRSALSESIQLMPWSLRISDISRVSVVRKEKKERSIYGVIVKEGERVFLLECHSGRVYLVKAPSEEQMSNWVGAIRSAILQNQSRLAIESAPSHPPQGSTASEPAPPHRPATRGAIQIAQLESRPAMHRLHSLIHQMMETEGHQLNEPHSPPSSVEEIPEDVVVRITDAPNVSVRRVQCEIVPQWISEQQLRAQVSEVKSDEYPRGHPRLSARYSRSLSSVK